MTRVFAAALLVCAVNGQERFPKPAPERAFAGIKIVDADGSPLRRAREDWAGARARIAEETWRPWLVARRAEVDDWMALRRDRVEWVAGWWHDFVNEKDGAFLEWTPEPPVGAKPKVFGGWVFGFRSRHGEKTLEAARLWRLTGERRYGEWAAAQLDFYAGHYEEWPVQTAKSKSRLMHQSLDDAVMLIRLVRAATALEGFADAERQRQWYGKLFRPMALLLDETFQRVHNIACWQRSAMGVAALYGKDEELWKRAVDGPFGIRTQMRDGVTSDWLWLEQSLLYNSYVVSALLPLFEAAGLAGRDGELRQEMAVAENLMLGPSALRFVTGKLPTPADSTAGFRVWPELGILTAARRVFPTGPGLQTAMDQRTWDTLLDPPESVGARALPEVVSRNLESSRMAVLRRGPWQVYFHYGQLDPSHAQAEALNYEAFFGATDVTHDAGTVGYGSPLHKELFQTAAAHNVPVVDGLGQARWNAGELLSFSDSAVAARQAGYRPGVSAERRLSIEGQRLVDSVKVATSDGASHRLGLVVQAQGKVELPGEFAADSVAAFPHWEVGRSMKTGNVARLMVRYGELRMELRVEASGPMKVTHAVTPDAPPARRESLYFEVMGQEAAFTTTWQPETVVAEAVEDARTAAQRKRIEMNLLGASDTEGGESRRNENVQFNLVDNNALKELNVRVGTTATLVQEFRADRGYFGAEFGVVPAAPPHVAPVKRDGFHGELRGSHLNSVTSARTFFQVGGVQPAHENDYGFRVGAAAWRGGSLQVDGGQQKLRGQVNGNVLVPRPDERTALATDPATRALVQRYLDAYPKQLPNRTDINPRALNTNAQQSINNDTAGVRLDQALGAKDKVAAQYGFTAQTVDAFQLVAGQNPDTRLKNHRARLTWTRAWDARTVSELTAGFDRLGSLLVPEPNAVGAMVSTAGLETLGPQAIIPIDRAVNVFRTAGMVRRAQNRHNWVAGFGVDRRQVNGTETDAHRGYFGFGNDFGNDGITNLRLGRPSQYIVSIGDVHRGFRNWEMQFYAGDTWRWRPGTTITASLRYQPVTVPAEVNGLNTIPYSNDLNNFAPSLGIAHRLPARWGLLRAAGGVQFGEIFPVTYSQVRFSPPRSVKTVVPAPDLVNPLANANGTAKGNLYLLDPQLATPYSYQYNASWEPELWKKWRLQLGYVGSRSHKLLLMWYTNRGHVVPGIPQTTATLNDRRPDSRYADIRWVLNGSRGYFDAARASLILPRWRGLSMEAAYWFSKAMDLGSAYTNTAYDADTRLSRSQYEYETRGDMKARSSFDQPHALVWRGTWSTWKGLTLAGVVLLKQGTPFTVSSGSDGPGFGNVDGNGADRPNLLDPSILGRTVGDPDTSRQLLPRAAFAYMKPTDDRGNLGRNTFRKGGIRNVNAQVYRAFHVDSRRVLTLRAESINLTNTPQFADPGLDLTNGNFGQITNTLNEGRTFRVGAQFSW
jgi:hypothetical protein